MLYNILDKHVEVRKELVELVQTLTLVHKMEEELHLNAKNSELARKYRKKLWDWLYHQIIEFYQKVCAIGCLVQFASRLRGWLWPSPQMVEFAQSMCMFMFVIVSVQTVAFFHDEAEKIALPRIHREKAFRLWDWLTHLPMNYIRVNTLLQIGVQFQLASMYEPSPAKQMADEEMAVKTYLTALGIKSEEFGEVHLPDITRPDIEMYVLLYVTKCLALCRFEVNIDDEDVEASDDEKKEPTNILKELKKRALWLAEFYPFAQVKYKKRVGIKVQFLRFLGSDF